MIDKKQSTAKGFMIISLAGILNKFLALIYLPIQTAIVGNFGNGIISSGYKIYIFIFALTNAGIPSSVAKLVSEQEALGNKTNSKKILKMTILFFLLISSFFATLMVLGAKFLSFQISQPKAYLMIIALAPTLVFTCISSSFKGYFQGKSNMIPTGISQVIEQFLNSLLTIVFAAILIKYGVEIAAAGTTIGTSIGALGSAVFLVCFYFKNKSKHDFEVNTLSYSLTNKDILKRVFIYSFPMVLGTISLGTSDIIDLKYIVSRMIYGGITYNEATELYGIYTNQYQKILNLPLTIAASLPVALMPAISTAFTLKNNQLIYKKINDALKIIFIIIVPSCVCLSILPKEIITFVFFSTSLNQGADLMMFGSWVLVIISIVYIQSSVLVGIGKPYIPPINMFIGLVSKIIINYFLIAIPSINVKGAIIGNIVGYFISVILNQIYIKKYLKLLKINFFRLILLPLIASIAMGGVIYLLYSEFYKILNIFMVNGLILNDICLLISLFVGFIVYLNILLFIKGIHMSDIETLPVGKKIKNMINHILYFKQKSL